MRADEYPVVGQARCRHQCHLRDQAEISDVLQVSLHLHHSENMQKGNSQRRVRCGSTLCLLQILGLLQVQADLQSD